MRHACPVLLDPDNIKDNLGTQRVGRAVVVYKSTASTNDVAWRYAETTGGDGTAVFAEQQTAGRGRGANKWFGGESESILCSILLVDCHIQRELFVLAGAVAVAEAVGRCGRCEAKIRWPNDIILNEKKVAGVLVESRKHGRRLDYVLGVGINCHQRPDSFPSDICESATSIDIESPVRCDRTSLARRLCVCVEQWLDVAQIDTEGVLTRWRQLSTLLGERVTMNCNRRTFSGNCIGLDPQKGLIVQLDRGGVRMFDAAHTTLVRQA